VPVDGTKYSNLQATKKNHKRETMLRSRGLQHVRSIITRATTGTRNASVQFTQTTRTNRIPQLMGLILLGGAAYYTRQVTQIQAEEPAINADAVNVANPEDNTHGVNDDYRYVLEHNPLLEALRNLPKDQFGITLYQYMVCPFCCKVRAYLDYHQIPYTIVEVNPITKSEIKFSNYKKVPVMVVQGQQLNDSSVIISSLSEIIDNKNTSQRDENEIKWRKWVDHKFVHTIPPNIYRSMEEATAAFDYISDMNNFSWIQRMTGKYAGSFAMFAVSKKLKKRHNIVDERAAIYECAKEWEHEIGDKPFHGGDKPNLADLAVYGVLSSIEGLQTFHDVVANLNIGPWYERTKNQIKAKGK
jgi:microsomal prostaglandin-E synthase 2